MSEIGFTVVADGLRFPEGPVAMPDGSVVLVEMFGPRITRVLPDGTRQTLADVPGGPNGLALGADGMLYLCNNGGSFTPVQLGEWLLPGPFDAARHVGGSIQRVDPVTGDITTLYTECDGRALRAPNDLVFDAAGGFWFTDHGARDERARTADLSAVYYAAADGSSIVEVVFPTDSPNGIGLAPDGGTLYWAETHTGRVFQRSVTGPGQLADAPGLATGGALLCGLAGYQLLDSLAVDGAGNVCVATLINGGITVIAPTGEVLEHIPTGDPVTTNICFGDGDGSGDFRDAYVTLSASGKLVRCRWPYPGLRLNWL